MTVRRSNCLPPTSNISQFSSLQFHSPEVALRCFQLTYFVFFFCFFLFLHLLHTFDFNSNLVRNINLKLLFQLVRSIVCRSRIDSSSGISIHSDLVASKNLLARTSGCACGAVRLLAKRVFYLARPLFSSSSFGSFTFAASRAAPSLRFNFRLVFEVRTFLSLLFFRCGAHFLCKINQNTTFSPSTTFRWQTLVFFVLFILFSFLRILLLLLVLLLSFLHHLRSLRSPFVSTVHLCNVRFHSVGPCFCLPYIFAQMIDFSEFVRFFWPRVFIRLFFFFKSFQAIARLHACFTRALTSHSPNSSGKISARHRPMTFDLHFHNELGRRLQTVLF